MTDIHPKAKEREEFRDVFGPLIAKLGGPNELSSLTYGVFVFRNHKGWGATAAEQFEAGFVSATTARNWLSELDGDDATYSSIPTTRTAPSFWAASSSFATGARSTASTCDQL